MACVEREIVTGNDVLQGCRAAEQRGIQVSTFGSCCSASSLHGSLLRWLILCSVTFCIFQENSAQDGGGLYRTASIGSACCFTAFPTCPNSDMALRIVPDNAACRNTLECSFLNNAAKQVLRRSAWQCEKKLRAELGRVTLPRAAGWWRHVHQQLQREHQVRHRSHLRADADCCTATAGISQGCVHWPGTPCSMETEQRRALPYS